ncbi:SDR family NAD(P)-dependent oxidoreductase [Zoogloea sp. LCSB751]|uniref:SDR family NAD(P)-dependent oxidoreductase n=1 Tax=Zoogloea sp. LCSB751 TaxID=1965277 RepID=UPI0009A512FF|nr:SDR family NAD(P)-dependent oxidoreductase [Zoogloea sp. LCSB751]
MTQTLTGRTVVVTGAFGFLGNALAARLVKEGARVALIDRAPVPASPLPGVELAQGEVDLGSPESASKAFGRIAETLGSIDALVNVAGGFVWETLADGCIESWDRMYGMNLRTAVIASQAVLPYLLVRGYGRLVNVGALGAVKAAAGMGAYAASKAGVARLTEALAEELKDKGVTVNAVLPSIIDTPTNRADMPDADPTRWVSTDALASVIVFLLSEEASAVNGALIPVSGRV